MAERQLSVEAQVAVHSEQLSELRRDLESVREDIHGPPWERSVRGRLHRLEGDASAAALATATLAEAQAERRRMHKEMRAARHWTTAARWKLVGAATALLIAVYPYLAHFAGWGS